MQIKYIGLGLIAAVVASVLADPNVNGVQAAGAGKAVVKYGRRDLRIAKMHATAIRRRYARRSEADEEEEDEDEKDEEEKDEDEKDEDEKGKSGSQSLSRRDEEPDEEEEDEDEPDEDEGSKNTTANAPAQEIAPRQDVADTKEADKYTEHAVFPGNHVDMIQI